MPTDTTNDRLTLRAMIEGYQLSQALAVLAHLGIPDFLGSDIKSIDELVTATSADVNSLRRLLRALVTTGTVAEVPGDRFRLTPLGDGLRSNVPGSLAATATQAGQPEMWHAWGHLLHSVMTGESGFHEAHGMDVWTYRDRHPEAGARFDAAMEEGAQHVARAITAAYPFDEMMTVVDVGGGTGVVLEAILKAYPEIRGVLQDQPQVIARAQERLNNADVASRCTFVAGDFFVEVPPGGDLYILKGILHDWNDVHAHQILATCRRAMRAGTRLLVIEQLLAEHGTTDPFARFMDLHMLVIHGAYERSDAAYADLLTSAGFRVVRVLPTGTGLHVIEAIVD